MRCRGVYEWVMAQSVGHQREKDSAWPQRLATYNLTGLVKARAQKGLNGRCLL